VHQALGHSVRRPFVFADERERSHDGAHLVCRNDRASIARSKTQASLFSVWRPETITLRSKKSKSVQAGSSSFKSYLSNRGIVAVGQMVDAHEMDSLIGDGRFPVAPCRPEQSIRRDVKSKE
jgi:hypothetical protein